MSELASDEKILETLQTFRDDDLSYSSMKVSDSEKELISELKRSLQEDEDVDYLKVCSLLCILFISLFCISYIPEFPPVSTEKKSPR